MSTIFDIALGIIFSKLVGIYFDIDPMSLVSWGILFSVLPDIDGIIAFLSGRIVGTNQAHKHRESLFHAPIVYVLSGTVVISLISLFTNQPLYPIIILFILCSLGHFLNDSLGYLGWGLRWLAPFSDLHFKLFTAHSIGYKLLKTNILTIWTTKQVDELSQVHGDPNWVRNFLLSRKFAFEVLVILGAVLFLFI